MFTNRGFCKQLFCTAFYKEGPGLHSVPGDGIQFGRHCPPSGGFRSHLKFDMDSRRAAFESPDSSFRK